MLTTDAKPDPPRDTDNDTEYLSTVNFNQEYVAEKSNVNTVLPYSLKKLPFTQQKRHFSTKKFNFFQLKNDNKTVDPDKSTSAIPKVRHKSNQNPDSTVNCNIINSSGVKIGATTTYICNVNQLANAFGSEYQRKKTKLPKSMPINVKMLCNSKELLTIDDIYLIKTHTGFGWRKVFLSLGYSNGQLEQFLENHKIKGIGEVIYQVLVDWKCANGRDACIGSIVQKLWEHEECDCVERLVKLKQEICEFNS